MPAFPINSVERVAGVALHAGLGRGHFQRAARARIGARADSAHTVTRTINTQFVVEPVPTPRLSKSNGVPATGTIMPSGIQRRIDRCVGIGVDPQLRAEDAAPTLPERLK